jgi:hypothetical protein
LVEVEQWAEIRRMHFVCGLSIKEIARRTGRDRNTVRRALRSSEPPRYVRAPRPSKLEPFKDEIHRLLREDPKLPGQRVRELIEPLGYAGSKTILDDYLRELRPLFAPTPRSFQRTVYRPAEICQFDLWEPSEPVAVGHLEQRRAWVVVACLGYSRAGAGALVFAKETPDLLWGVARCLVAWRSPEDLGLGSPGRHPCPRRSTDPGGVRSVLSDAGARAAPARVAAGVRGLSAASRASADDRDRSPARGGDPARLARAAGHAVGRAGPRARRRALALGPVPGGVLRADDLRAPRGRAARDLRRPRPHAQDLAYRSR